MKHIRVILCCLLAVAMLVTLTGCQQSTPTPTAAPTEAPTATPEPTAEPTEEPTAEPTAEPTEEPTAEPTEEPTAEPTEEPTEEPTAEPVAAPASISDEEPVATAEPTEEPTAEPTEEPTAEPTEEPTAEPTAEPTEVPAENATPSEPQADDLIAKAGELTLTYGETIGEVEMTKTQYASLMQQYYGQTIDVEDVEFQRVIAETVAQGMMEQKVYLQKFEDLGMAITDERMQEIEAEVQAMYDDMYEQYTQYFQMSYGLTDEEEIKTEIENLFAQNNYSIETLTEAAVVSEKLTMLYEYATKDVAVTDQDVKAAYDAKVAEAKELYDADKEQFVNDYVNEAQIVYTPEGIRLIQHVLVMKEDDPAEDAATPSDAQEASPSETDAVLAGRAKVEKALEEIEGGMDFTEAIGQYGEDSGMQMDNLKAGYPVFTACTGYDQSFVDNAMALEKIGDVSGIVETTYGYHILRYAADLTPGAVAYDDLKESLTATVTDEMKSEAYAAAEKEWLAEYPVELVGVDLLVSVVEAAPAAVPELIYNRVSEEMQLLDKPEGIAIATLAPGVRVSVEGYITVSGKEYAYVTVLGSNLLGYVETATLEEITQEEAEDGVTDEGITALAVDPAGKLPLFTLVMNDGSVVYGELYPETAPQSVGNFIALANDEFYNGLKFHRVIAGFMIQGGDPSGNGTGGPGYAIKGEFTNNGVENAVAHERGVLSMARSTNNDSAGSQFFICHADAASLDGQYAAFGRVLEGMDTVDAIASTPTDSSDAPKTEQVMKLVHVETYGADYPFDKIVD